MVESSIAEGYVAGMTPVQYSNVAQKSLSRMQPKRQAAIKAKVDVFALGKRVDLDDIFV